MPEEQLSRVDTLIGEDGGHSIATNEAMVVVGGCQTMHYPKRDAGVIQTTCEVRKLTISTLALGPPLLSPRRISPLNAGTYQHVLVC